MYRSVLALLFAAVLLLSGCAAGQQTVPKEKSEQEANMDGPAFDRSDEEITYMDTTENVIYLAGGCFWGMEHLMQSIPGVIDAESGYANGTCEADADYKTVCKGENGFRETVRVEYDPEQVSLDALLLAYFYVIDPTVENRQGNDRGSQYQTGVYYTNESAKRRWSASRKSSGDAARSSSWRSARSRTTIPPRSTTRTTSKRIRTATATSRARRWSSSPGCASTRATIRSPRRSPSGTS